MKMISMHCKMMASGLYIGQVAFRVQHPQRMSSPYGIRTVMIERAFQDSWQAVEIILALYDIVVRACLESLDRSFFVTHSGNHYHGQRQTVFTNMFQQKKTIAFRQMHVGEDEIERL